MQNPTTHIQVCIQVFMYRKTVKHSIVLLWTAYKQFVYFHMLEKCRRTLHVTCKSPPIYLYCSVHYVHDYIWLSKFWVCVFTEYTALNKVFMADSLPSANNSTLCSDTFYRKMRKWQFCQVALQLWNLSSLWGKHNYNNILYSIFWKLADFIKTLPQSCPHEPTHIYKHTYH